MKLLEDVESTHSGDPWYDITDGGYINPYDFLESDDAERVQEAVNTVKEFFDLLEENDLLGE